MSKSAIQDLSDAELSRLIAEKLESLEVRGDAETYVSSWGLMKGTPCWTTAFDIADDGDTAINIHWQPRSMVNDPAMTLMLTEKMPEPQVWLESSRDEAPKQWGCWADMHDNGATSVLANSIGRAVAEAFLMSVSK